MILKFDVTQEHIEKGEQGSPWSCAVNLALKDKVKKDALVTVSVDYAVIEKNFIPGNNRLSDFIVKFDSSIYGDVSPDSFELEIKDDVWEKIRKEEKVS